MRTWKQGIIGEISVSQSTSLYIHCLKYPLAKVYKEFRSGDQTLSKYMFSIMIDKSVLKSINRIGEKKLSKEENIEGGTFIYNSKESRINVRNNLGVENKLLERVYKLEEIIDKYKVEK